ELAKRTEPSIGYVAFYSDVEHEVALVTSGYRVTLTYNLYYAADTPEPSIAIRQFASEGEVTFKAGLLELLDDPTVLPAGGIIGFGLQHEYPVNDQTTLIDMVNHLKGGDALVKRACDQLCLKFSLMFAYKDKRGDRVDHSILSPVYIDLSEHREVANLKRELLDCGGMAVRDALSGDLCEDDSEYDPYWQVAGEDEKPMAIYWVNKPTANASVKCIYMAYGNEASLSHYYAKVSLCVFVGPAGSRAQDREIHVSPFAKFEGEAKFKTAFPTALKERSILPGGGVLGFGLQYDLKGGNALARKVCQRLPLNAVLKFVHENEDDDMKVLSDRFPDLEGRGEIGKVGAELITHSEKNILEQGDIRNFEANLRTVRPCLGYSGTQLTSTTLRDVEMYPRENPLGDEE
ncbi:hypothetical protein HWV62_1440, partial [Athelia sp. TMB]